METILIVVHLMVVLALVGVVLLQRSEGGGLGIGGGSGFMTARGAANALTRATAILAAAFFATSLILSILARYGDKPIDILDRAPATQQNGGGNGVLDQLPGTATPAAPSGNTAPTPPSGNDAPAAQQPGAAAPVTPPASGATPPASSPAAQPAQPQVPNQ
ncbi:preprotein translocase subunit SecG [Mesorhizobium sp. BE184]|uniref:preprotein translocase subunit SecG n=1 Tax=Mesorhizobium sp. BE184 TaxID=2817714 RepID=UPI0028568415|nr:preprotein translocase subunit SecG [Mesorhizobium sp. BE184]MDR7032638.1 preprotein translocase subunit SecG [Mesorhizobium sp. BE184]